VPLLLPSSMKPTTITVEPPVLEAGHTAMEYGST
jgi:hypothetical protein